MQDEVYKNHKAHHNYNQQPATHIKPEEGKKNLKRMTKTRTVMLNLNPKNKERERDDALIEEFFNSLSQRIHQKYFQIKELKYNLMGRKRR